MPLPAPTRDEVLRAASLFQSGALPELCRVAQDLARRYPDHAAGWVFLGTALERLGQPEQALPALQRAVALQPGQAAHHAHLGAVFLTLGRRDEAQAAFEQALALDPRDVESWLHLAKLHTEGNALGPAEQAYREALSLMPGHAEAHFQLAVLCSWQLRWRDAEAHYRGALAVAPDSPPVLDALGHALLEQGRAAEALACARRALALQPTSTDLLSNLLFTRNYVERDPAASVPDEARRYGRQMTVQAGAGGPAPRPQADPATLRVGLVSGDLRRHAVGSFLSSVLGRSSATDATVAYYAYSTSPIEDDVTQRLKRCGPTWRTVAGMRASEAAQAIVDDGIHVLIDLSGHSGQCRLDIFAQRPAPVQVGWLGYPATTGLPQMDVLLTAPHVTEPADQACFSERLWPLPETWFCYEAPAPEVAVGELPVLSQGAVTFASFNNLTKLTDEVVQVWSRILQGVPGSRLVLRSVQMADPGVLQATAERFARQGIAADRLRLLPPIQDPAAHLAGYNGVDIALDTFPFGGGTTTVEAVYMGVPVVTLRGQGGLLRLGESVLRTLSLDAWIAGDIDTYVQTAVAAAGRQDELVRLRETLRGRMRTTSLLDAPRFADGFEQTLWRLWQTHVGRAVRK